MADAVKEARRLLEGRLKELNRERDQIAAVLEQLSPGRRRRNYSLRLADGGDA
jgi:hypothetical protein